jgi:hypothetical protein
MGEVDLGWSRVGCAGAGEGEQAVDEVPHPDASVDCEVDEVSAVMLLTPQSQ